VVIGHVDFLQELVVDLDGFQAVALSGQVHFLLQHWKARGVRVVVDFDQVILHAGAVGEREVAELAVVAEIGQDD
jgi:hypothetical protein